MKTSLVIYLNVLLIGLLGFLFYHFFDSVLGLVVTGIITVFMLLLDWRLRNNVSNSKRVFPKWLVYYGIIVIISILLFVNGADQFILTIYEFALIILNFAFFFYFLLRYFARKKEIQK